MGCVLVELDSVLVVPVLIQFGDELSRVRHLLDIFLNEYLIFLPLTPLTPLKIGDPELTSLPNIKKSSFDLVKKKQLQLLKKNSQIFFFKCINENFSTGAS